MSIDWLMSIAIDDCDNNRRQSTATPLNELLPRLLNIAQETAIPDYRLPQLNICCCTSCLLLLHSHSNIFGAVANPRNKLFSNWFDGSRNVTKYTVKFRLINLLRTQHTMLVLDSHPLTNHNSQDVFLHNKDLLH